MMREEDAGMMKWNDDENSVRDVDRDADGDDGE